MRCRIAYQGALDRVLVDRKVLGVERLRGGIEEMRDMTMREPVIIEMLPCAADYNRLRKAVGWGEYREDVISDSLPHSLYCICALIDEQVIGMARIIGDAGMVYYIQDVIVLPEYQMQGIGTRMMERIMDYLQSHAHQNTIIGLMSAVGKEQFYEKYGFTRRPTEKLGAGMTIFWNLENSLTGCEIPV